MLNISNLKQVNELVQKHTNIEDTLSRITLYKEDIVDPKFGPVTTKVEIPTFDSGVMDINIDNVAALLGLQLQDIKDQLTKLGLTYLNSDPLPEEEVGRVLSSFNMEPTPTPKEGPYYSYYSTISFDLDNITYILRRDDNGNANNYILMGSTKASVSAKNLMSTFGRQYGLQQYTAKFEHPNHIVISHGTKSNPTTNRYVLSHGNGALL